MDGDIKKIESWVGKLDERESHLAVVQVEPGKMVNRLSLRTKLISSFLFVVIAGGLLSSLIGTRLVADTIVSQARSKVQARPEHGLADLQPSRWTAFKTWSN